MVNLSRYVKALDDFAKCEAAKKYTFFNNRNSWGFKVFASTFFIGFNGIILWVLSIQSTKEPLNSSPEYILPDVNFPDNPQAKSRHVFRATQCRRRLMGLPERSSYMVNIRDFEADGPIIYRGDYPKHWWTIDQ